MMLLLRPSMHRYAAAMRHASTSTRQAARDAIRSKDTDISIPILPSCPSPSCECADMPADLDIDRSTNLNASMAPYQEHLVVASGQADWKSKIEDERGSAAWGDLVASVKKALGLKGQFHNPYHNVIVSTSSFEMPRNASANHTSRALLFPSFRMVENLESSQQAVTDFIQAFLLPEKLHPAYDQDSGKEQAGKTRDATSASSASWAGKIHPISAPTILICSHNTRDSRCGILGPLLHTEFMQYINKRHTLRNRADELVDSGNAAAETFSSHPAFKPDLVDRETQGSHPINVGMISHIGGHKFAGNVIIYIPPDYQCLPLERTSRGTQPKDQTSSQTINSSPPSEDDVHGSSHPSSISPLAGKGIWYGRVEPKHVEGIVEQTIGHGRIIRDLFRGGINADGSQIRLPLY